ncbi:MAG: alpha-1,2-fucosyltransferase [Gammaproteobacteria bacterium]|nr:alpha-1,2-fucosyltransferase [Gammaproteobacteria bacterium]
MIVTRILGGLGNQLFAYSAARRLSFINNCELVIDDVSGFAQDFEYQRQYQLHHFNIDARKATPTERFAPLSRVRRYLTRFSNRWKEYGERDYIQQEGVGFDSRLLTIKARGRLYLEGYWQSEQYFKDIESIIRSDLRITPPTDDENLNIASKIQSNLSVAVHVRFFDAPDQKGLNNAPAGYYQRSLLKMDELIPNAHYFIFSDAPDAACELVLLPRNRFTLVSHNKGDEHAYADLWLMSQCKHFIIANSTFSWWGAWLSKNPHKHVIAPGFNISGSKTSWGFDGLLPQHWRKL